MKKYIVCDYYSPDATINIDAISDTFEKAKREMEADIDEVLSNHNYCLDDNGNAVPLPDTDPEEPASVEKQSENNITLIVDDQVLCDWFIIATEIPLTPLEREQIFREVKHDYCVQDVEAYFEDHRNNYDDVISEKDFDAIAALFEKAEDCNVAFNDTMQSVFEQYAKAKEKNQMKERTKNND